MEQKITTASGENQPRWDLINQQVKRFKQFACDPVIEYQPYLIR